MPLTVVIPPGTKPSKATNFVPMAAAMASSSVEARDAYLADAESMLLESGYVIPLCGTVYRYLMRGDLTGLLCRDMGVYNFSFVTEIAA